MWHQGLVFKLNKIGLNPIITKWISNFLKGRCCAVKVNNVLSEPFSPVFGVPQGSPLSPILFILYVSDIPSPKSSSINITQFADDISVWCTRSKISLNEKVLQVYLNDLDVWCRLWRINLNASKTVRLDFCQSSQANAIRGALTLYGKTIEHKHDTKFLGITIDANKFK